MSPWGSTAGCGPGDFESAKLVIRLIRGGCLGAQVEGGLVVRIEFEDVVNFKKRHILVALLKIEVGQLEAGREVEGVLV